MRYRALEVRPHIFSGNPDRFYALLASPSIAVTVALCRSFEVVSHPIDFNSHSGPFAEEVENKRPERKLSPEMEPFGTKSKNSP